jgi:hypothetical protein
MSSNTLALHPALVLHLFCFNIPCQFTRTPLLNLRPLIFWFNALWLAVFYYANPLLLMGNIIFDLHPLFQEHNSNIKHGPGVFDFCLFKIPIMMMIIIISNTKAHYRPQLPATQNTHI